MKMGMGIAALLLAATGSAAMADFVDVQYLGTGQGRNVRITHGSTTENVFAGQLRHRLSNGTGRAATWIGTFLTFCTETNQRVTSTTRQYRVTDVALVPGNAPMGADKADAIARLYAFAAPSALTSSTNHDFAAAVQLAIWEIVHDFSGSVGRSSLSVTTGGFRATQTNGNALSSTINNHLNTLFNAAFNTSIVTNTTPLVAITNGSAQDQLVNIPAPGAVALAGLGALLACPRRRK